MYKEKYYGKLQKKPTSIAQKEPLYITEEFCG